MTEKTETFKELMEEDNTIPVKNQPVSAPKKPPISRYPGETKMPSMRHAAPSQYYRSGLQTKTFQMLKSGKIPTEATIDLHGYKVVEAIQKLHVFVQKSQQDNQRCLRVICGKGLHSETGKPVLRSTIQAWLHKQPIVLAYCPASSRDGGDGAIYVLLKRK